MRFIFELQKIPLQNVLDKMDEAQSDNYNKVVALIEKNIPNYTENETTD